MSSPNEFVVSVRVRADAQQHNAEFAGAGSAVQAFAAAARTSSDASSASLQAVTVQAKQLADTTTSSAAQAQQALASVATAAQSAGSGLQAQSAQQQQASQAAARAIDQVAKANAVGTISAAQHAAAMRMLPAQMTDVVTSMASGMPIWLVAIQQGGQIKDSFGGAGNALKAMAGAVTPAAAAFGVLAAVGGAVALAYKQGSSEADILRREVVMTGNAAGTSVGQLTDMARAVGELTTTQGAATQALAQLAGTGVVANDNLQQFAETAINLERYVGQPVKATVQHLEQLGKAPLEASVKLNEQYHYLTDAVYKQIKALQDQGKQDEAASLAQRTYSQAMAERSAEMRSHMGTLERGWDNLGRTAARAWDAMLNIGRAASLSDIRTKIDATNTELNKLLYVDGFSETGGGAATGGGNRGRAAAIARLRKELGELQAQAAPLEAQESEAQLKAEKQAKDQAEVEARGRIETMRKAVRTRAQIRQDEIDQLNRDRKTLELSTDEYNKLLAGIEQKYKDPKGSAATGRISATEGDVARMRSQLQASKQYYQQLVELGAGATDLNDAERESLKIAEQLKVATDAKTVARLKEMQTLADQRAVQLRTNDGLEKSIKTHQQAIEALEKEAVAIEGRAREQEAANAVFGKGKTAIEEMTLATLKNRLAETDQTDNHDPKFVASLDRKTEAQKRWLAALQQGDVKAINQRADELLRSANELAKVYADELALSGLTGLEREKIVAQRQVELKYAKEIAAIEKSTLSDADKQLAKDKVYQAQRIESTATVAKATQNYMARTSDEINRSLTDALMRGFENGKGFAENFRDTVKNMFNTLVLRPIISAIMTPVSMGINSVVQGGLNTMGLGGGGGGSGSGGFSMPGLPSFGGSSYFSAGMAGGWAGFEGGLTMMQGGQWAAGGMQALGAAAPYIGALIQIGQGKYGAGLGTAAGAYIGSIVPGIGTAIGAIIGSVLGGLLDGGARGANHSGAAYSTAGVGNDKAAEQLFGRAAGDWYDDLTKRHSSALEKQLKTSLDGWSALYGNLGKWAKGGVRDVDLVGGFAVNGRYQDEDSYGYGKIIDKVTGQILAGFENRNLGTNPDEAYKAYMTQFGPLLVSELKKADLPSWMRTMLESVGEEPSIETLQAAFQTIELIGRSFEQLGKTITGFAEMTDLAFESLIKASGGIEALNANAGSFYQNFYSEDERKATAKKELDKQLKDLGVNIDLDADDAQAQFRKVVEDKLKAASGEEANSKALADVFAKGGGAEGLKDLAKTGAFKDWVTSNVGEGTAEVSKLTADLENLAKTSTSLAEFTAGVDKLAGSLGGTGKSSAETAAELLKLNTTFKAVTKTSEEAAAAAAKEAEAKAKAAEEAKKKEEDARKAAIDAAYANLQAAVEREREGLQQRLEDVRAVQDSLTSVVEAAGGAVRELRGNVQATAEIQARQAMATIDSALAALRSGAALPMDSAALTEAMSVAQSSITEASFASVQDYERAQLALAIKLSEISDTGGKQLTDAQRTAEGIERQITQNDKALDFWRKQIDGTNKNIDATLSVDQAIRRIEALLTPDKALGGGGSGGSKTPTPDWGGGGGGFAPANSGKYKTPTAVLSGGVVVYDYAGDDYTKRLDALAPTFQKWSGTGDFAGLAADFQKAGGTAQDLAYLYGYSLNDVNAAIDRAGIPRFEFGGLHLGGARLVGERGPELEVTGPARYWSADQTRSILGGSGGGNGAGFGRIEALLSQIVDAHRKLWELLNRAANDGQRSREVLEGAARGNFGLKVTM